MVLEEEHVSILGSRTVISLKVMKTTAMGGALKPNAFRLGVSSVALTVESCIGE